MLSRHFFLLFALILHLLNAGYIYPDNSNPILPTRTNEQAIADYTFYMSLQTSISLSPTIIITFPYNQYNTVVSGTCSVLIIQSSVNYTNPCTSSINVVTIVVDQDNFPLIQSGSIQITIYSVQNPNNWANLGTGNFQIVTQSKGGITVDQNTNFGSIGIAPPYITRSSGDSSMSNDGSALGGFLTNYVLSFTNYEYLRTNSWFRLTFPIDFSSYGDIQCTLESSSLPLDCSRSGQVVAITGLTIPLFPGTNLIKFKNIYNPFINGLTNNFIFESLQPGVNTVIEYYSVTGVMIQPGLINNPTISAYPLNMNLYVDYTITFTPTNIIPAGGFIIVQFPPQFGVLATTCRVILGLSDGTSPITCPVTGYQVKIMNFAQATPQLMEIKVYATNPATAGVATSQFTITSYQSPTEIIDMNLNAGSIIVQDIDNPFYLYINLYTAIVNSSFSVTAPLDFRLYPNSANTLPATTLCNSVQQYGEIWLQIPLWWKNYGDTYSSWFPSGYPTGYSPICYFGGVYSPSCTHNLQLYKMQTPSSGDASRYSTTLGNCAVGLGQCDVPISITNVIVTPIPGRWDFRVLTFAFTNPAATMVPLEQDLFTMDIPYTSFSSVTLETTSKDQNDINNIIRLTFSSTMILPWEGAINLNLTVQDDVYSNSAGWPVTLGFTIATNSYMVIPCRIEINGVIEGYTGAPNHPNAQCFLFTGQTTPTPVNTILQVRGFSFDLNPYTPFQVDIPDVEFCTTLNMNCYIELTTSYTTSLVNPYTLTYYRASMGVVTGPSIETTTNPTGFSVAFTPTEICLAATYKFTMDFTNPLASSQLNTNDHVLIKFPDTTIVAGKSPFTFSRNGGNALNLGGATIGAYVVIYNFFTSKIYYLVRITTTFTTGNGAVIELPGIRNANYPSPTDPNPDFPTAPLIGLIFQQIYWASQRFCEQWSYPISSPWTDGGITSASIMILPSTTNGDPYTIDIDYNNWITHRIAFTICREIPASGAVKVTVPFNDVAGSTDYLSYQGMDTTCEIWSGLVGTPIRLTNEMTCSRTGNYFVIEGFLATPQYSVIQLLFKVLIKTTAITTQPVFTVQTFFNSAWPLNAGSPNEIDYMSTGNEIQAEIYNGPMTFPPLMQWGEFIQKTVRARAGDRGPLFMNLITNFNILAYNSASSTNGYLRVGFDGTMVVGLPYLGVLECRINGYLSQSCFEDFGISGTSFGVRMLMPPGTSVTAGVSFLLMISSRNADDSATLYEGLQWGNAGLFELTIQSLTSGLSIIEYTKTTMQVYPQELLNFWVWSASKMRTTSNSAVIDSANECSYLGTTGNTEIQCGLTLIRIYFSFPTAVAASNTPNSPTIIVEFARTNLPTYTNGFAIDLNTGLNHLDPIPCYVVGIAALAGTSITCQLYYGTWPNPTRVFISGFDVIAIGTSAEIHIPKIFNPNSTLELISVSVTVQETVAGATVPLMQAEYTLVNTTYQYPAPFVPSVTLITLVTTFAVTFVTTTIDTSSFINIKFQSNSNLAPGDVVIWEFPVGWQLNVPCTHTFADAATCESYISCNWVALDLQNAITAGTIESGTISMTSPPFTYITPPTTSPVKAYIYSRSKLLYILTYPPFTQTMTVISITPYSVTTTSAITSTTGEWTIEATIPEYVPGTGAIRITLPSIFLSYEPSCRNDVIAGSTLNDLGFSCNYVLSGTTSYYIIQLGGYTLAANSQILVKANLLNPATAQPTSWSIETFYLYETPLNLLMCHILNFAGAAITAASSGTAVTYWDNQHRTQNILHSKDVGPVRITVTFTNTITHNPTAGSLSTWYVVVQISNSFSIHAGGQIHATWNYNQAYFTSIAASGSYNLITIYAPQSVDVTGGTSIYLNLTTLNANDGNNGFNYPLTQGSYDVTVSLYDAASGTAVLKETGVVYIFVPYYDFTLYSSSSLIVNGGYYTLFTIKFQPQSTVGAGGYLMFYVPTAVEFTGEALFGNDLGTGLNNGGPITCNYDTGSNFAGTMSCQLFYGNQNSGTPASIKVSGFTNALSSGSFYIFRIQMIKIPAETTATDTKQVWTRLESYTSGGTLVNSGICYDFTIITANPITDLTSSPSLTTAPTATSYQAGATGVTFTLSIKSPVALSYTDTNDYFVIEFPQPIFPTIATATLCTIKSAAACTLATGYNWVIYKPNVSGDNLVANTFTSLGIQNANQALYDNSNGIQLKAYVIARRILTQIYYFQKLGTSITTNSIPITVTVTTPNIDPTMIPKSTSIKFLISIVLPSGTGANNVPSGGLLDIQFPTGYVLESFCQNDVSSQMTYLANPGDIICSNTPDSTKYSPNPYYGISGYATIPTGSTVNILAYATTPTTSATAGNLYIYADSARTQQMYTYAITFPAVQTTYTGFQQLKVPDEGRTPVIIRQNGQSFFQFEFIPGVLFTSITVSFPTASSVTLQSGAYPICYFGDYQAASCTTTTVTGTSLALLITPPLSPTLTLSATYLVTIDTSCGTNNGLLFEAAGLFYATVILGANTRMFPFRVLSSTDFSDASMIMTWANQGTTSDLIVKLTPTTPIPTNGNIVVTFPVINYLRTRNLFSQNLGYAAANYDGAPINCYSVSTDYLVAINGEIDCTLYITAQNPYIKISGFVGFSNAIQLIIPNIMLPTVATDDGFVDLKLHSQDASGNILDERVIFDVVSPQTFTPTNSALTAQTCNPSCASISIGSISISANQGLYATAGARIVVVLPNIYNLDYSGSYLSNSPGCTLKVYKNVLICTPTTTGIAASSSVTLTLQGITPVPATYTSDSISVYVIYNRVYTSIYSVALTVATVADFITGTDFSMTVSNSFASLFSDYQFSFSPGVGIQPKSIIKIVFTSSFTINRVQIFSGLTGPYTITVTSSTLLITLSNAYAMSDGIINIQVTTTNPVAGSYSAQLFIISDSTATITIKKSALQPITILAQPVSTLSSNCFISINGAQLTLKLTPNTLTITNWANQGFDVRIYGLPGLSSTTTGSITDSRTTSVTVTTGGSNSEAYFMLSSPTNLTTSVTETIVINALNTDSSSFAYSFLAFIVMEGTPTTFYEMCPQTMYGTVQSATSANQFTSGSITYGHTSAGQLNYFAATVTAALAMSYTSTTGIYMAFSYGFLANLGFSLNDGDYVPCYISGHINLKCVLSRSDSSSKGETRIYMQNFNSVSVGNTITAYFFRVMNPANAGVYSVRFAYYDDTNSNDNFDQIMAYVEQTFIITTLSISSTSSALTLSTTTIQQATSGTQTLSTTLNLAANDQVLFFLDQVTFNTAATDSANVNSGNSDVSCTWYTSGQMAICIASSAVAGGINFQISNFNNPTHKKDGNAFICYTVSGTSIGQYIDFTVSFNNGVASGWATAMDPAGGTVRFSSQLTLPSNIPEGGCIEIAFGAGAFSSPLLMNLEIFSGTYQGKFTGELIGSKLYLRGFSFFTGGTPLNFLFTMSGATSGGSCTVTVTSYAIEPENFGANPYSIDTGTFSLAVPATMNTLAVWSPTRYLIGYTRIAKSANSFINFKIKLTSNLATTQFIRLRPGAAFALSTTITQPFRCRFTLVGRGSYYLQSSYESSSCYMATVSSSVFDIVIQAPTNAAITNTNYYEIIIFLAETNNQAGFQTSGSNYQYPMGVYLLSSSATPTTNINEFNTAMFNNIISSTQGGCVRSILSEASTNNLIHFDLVLNNAVTSGNDYLEILLPVTRFVTSSSENLYSINLGTATNTLANFKCNYEAGLSTSSLCEIWYGELGYETRPIRITISNYGSLSIGETISFDIPNLINPASQLFTSAVFYSYTLNSTYGKVIKDYYNFPFVTYSITPITATAEPTLVFPNPTTGGLSVDAIMTMTLLPSGTTCTLSNFDGYWFTYDTNFFNPSAASTPTGAMSSVQVTNYYMSEGNNFIILNSGQTSACTQSVVWSNLKNTAVSGAYTSASAWTMSLIQNHVRTKTFTYKASASPTYLPSTFTISNPPNQAVRAATTLATTISANSASSIQFDFTVGFSLGINSALSITFPTGFTNIVSSATIMAGYNGGYSVIVIGQAVIIYNNNQAITSGTTFTLILQATTPASGTIGTFGYNAYTSYPTSGSNLKATFTSPSGLLTITSQVGINGMQIWGLSVWKAAQMNDYGPVEFTFKASAAITMKTGSVTIASGTLLWNTVIVNTAAYDDMKCFWGNLAAYTCQVSAQGFQIFAPTSNSIVSGNTYIIFIATNRAMTNGLLPQENFKYNTQATYSITVTPSSGTATTTSFVLSPPDFTNSFINNYITTINRYSIFLVSLTPTITINPNTGTTPGQILIEFQTANSAGVPLFPTDLGTGFTNGQSLDCVCTGTCPAGLECTLNKGAVSALSPSYIIVDSTNGFPSSSSFVLRFPKLQMPSTDMLFIQMRIVSRTYMAGIWTVLNELVHIDIFYTTVYTVVTTTTGLTTPSFSPNLVGQPGTISFGLTQNVGVVKTGYDDRYILESTTTEMVFEYPPATYRGNSYTLSVAGATVTLYPISKWIEVAATPSNLNSQTTLTFNSFKNMPYQIANLGINFNVYVWINGNLMQIYTFPLTAQANVNTFIDMTYTPLPPVIILQPNTYSFTFQPYNRIPANGKIVLSLPDCSACNFVFFDSYCQIQGGITDASCDIVPGSPSTMVVTGLSQIYDPFLPTATPISISFYTQNPSTTAAPGAFYFTLQTYYVDNNNNFLMDVETQFDAQSIRYSLQGGFIITATVQDIMQVPQVLCAGRTGPLILMFQFSGNLNYPNDYISINFYTSFSFTPTSITDELICYFNDMTNAHMSYIKSYRCTYTTTTTSFTVTIYIPEEFTPFSQSKSYQLTILSKMSGGFKATAPSGIYWAVITTSSTSDRAWTQVQIPSCPFDGSMFSLTDSTVTPSVYYLDTTFHVESFSKELSMDYVTDQTWTGINMTLTTTASAIPTGNVAVAQNSRILIEFPTNNEIEPCWDVNLGVISSGYQTEVGCAGQYLGSSTPLMPDPYTGLGCSTCYIYCTAVQAAGTTDNSTPAYVMFNNYEAIPAYTKFNLQVTRIANPSTMGTFSHIIIHVQSRMDDGTYYDIYYHPKFYLVQSYNSYPGGVGQLAYPKQSSGASRSGLSSNAVTQNMGNVTWQITNLLVSLNIGDIIVFEQNSPYVMSRKTDCSQMTNGGQWWNPVNRPQIGCAASMASKWFTIHNTIPLIAGTDQLYVVDYFNWIENSNWVNPDYEYKNPNGSPKSLVNVFVYQGQKLVSYYYFYQSPDRANIRLILQTSDAKNDVNSVITYSLGIILGTPKHALQYLKIWAPNVFTNVENCVIRRGLVLADMSDPENSIVCQITDITTNYLIEIYNFGTYNGDGWLMLELDLTNPATAGWTTQWTVETYASQPPNPDLTMVLDSSVGNNNNDAVTWVGAKPFPNLFRVYRNAESYYNRQASLGQYAEVDIRLIPKTTLPATTGSNSAWVQIWMPNDYDIPNGGTAVCQMGQNYHTDITGQYCQISSDRIITMYTNSGQGLGSACSLLTWTTTGAIGGDGVKLPSTPTTDSFQVYEYINNNLVEYSIPASTTQPQQLTYLTFIATIREQETNLNLNYRNTVYRITFQSNIDIPAGYDTTPNIADPLLKSPIGYITYEFNTIDNYVYGYDGYPNNLGQSTTNMPCRAMQGLVPPSGGSIQCTITYATGYNWFSLVLVTVSNFQAISSGTYVEIHFLECKPVWTQYNNGYIQVGAYQANADGTQNQIIAKTIIYLSYYLQITTVPDMSNLPSSYYLDGTTLFSINPGTNYVGTYSIMTFNFMVLNNMIGGSFLVFRFPSQFQLLYQSDTEIQAIIDGIVVTTVIYATGSVNELYFQVPTGQTIVADTVNYKTFQISQIRNMAYQLAPVVYQIEILLIQNWGIRQGNWIYINCPGAIAGPFSSLLMVLSSYFSGDVNVQYTFSVTPTYMVPSGSTITVYFPDHVASPYIGLNYNQLPLSVPDAVCTATPSNSINPATISANLIVMTTNADIEENTAIQILLTGAKNPTYVGPTVANDFYIDITNSLGALINTEGFPLFTFLPTKSANVLYMNIAASNLYKSVTCDYVFSLQPSTTVPTGGNIFLKFPPEWASSTLPSGCTVSSLTGTFTSSVLSYTKSYANNILTINPGFEFPAKSTLYIAMNGLVNPSNVDTTTVFQAYTQYDSVKLDVTDPTDVGLQLTFLDYDPTLWLATPAVIYPKNEAQTSTYNFNFTSLTNISSGSQLQLQFSSNYDPSLTTSNTGISCYSVALGGNVACTVSNGKLIIPINTNVTNITNINSSNGSNNSINGSNSSNATTASSSNVYLDLEVTGIMNPNSNSASSMDIVLSQGSTIISYKTNNCTFSIDAAPQTLNLTFLNTTSTNLQQKSNYTFCVQTYNPIPKNASVLIQFPSQFSLRQSSYGCEIATGHNATTYPIINGTQTPYCTVNDQLRIINISNQTSGYDGTGGVGVLCYEIDLIENPSDSGQSDNFVVSVYDEDTLNILYSTYGVLSYPSTITYSRQGLRITVGNIDTLYVGTMSTNISVTLQMSVPYAIYLTPSSVGFSFVPSVISFFSYLSSTQYFMIQPLSNATLGQNKISWSKNETTTADQFSEVADSFFVLAQDPAANVLTLTISPIILRTAQLGTSLPIQITLSVAPANNMTLYYETYKPNQPDYVVFNPENLTFGIGETQATFTYFTDVLAVSGQIMFWLDSNYSSKYTMNTNIINFEIMDIDNSPPTILNYYIVDMDRTYMYFRISTSESGWVYYILAYKGTKQPSNPEIKDPSIRVALSTETVWEQYGSNSSYQAPVTQTYIYYDTYFYFTGLEEQTDYILFFMVEDLSGNENPVSVAFPFTTLKKHLPAKFFLQLNEDVTNVTLLSGLGLVTGLPSSRFSIDNNPPKFSIPGVTDPVVLDLLNSQTTTYEMTLLQDPFENAIRPIERVKSLQTQKSILIGAIPELVSSYNIFTNAYEIIAFHQEFSYTPILTQVGQDSVFFNVSIRRNGSLYGIVMVKNSTVPYPRQMKYGLDSTNFLLDPEHFINLSFVYPSDNRGESVIYQIGNFTNLYDNTEYDAYFIADNDLPINPDLMDDDEILKVSFQTETEIFIIPDTYRATFGERITERWILMTIMLLTIIILI